MKLKIINKGFNYSQDGPGNRLVYHLAGCNMKCPWCANPEGMDPEGVYMTEKNGIRHLSFREVETDRLMEEVLSAKPVFVDGGGVTFSGGEPTFQFEALSFLLKSLHESGIHTAIETNAASPRLKELVPHLDLLIADFKHPDPAEHRRFTGLGNERVLKNLREISHMGIPMIIRTPLIHGVNTSEECLKGFVKAYSEGFDRTHVSLELLSYHEFGVQKWEKCGKEYTVQNGHVAPETVKRFEDTYREAGFKVIRT